MMNGLRIIFCTFAAIWLPVVMLSGFFGLDGFRRTLAVFGEWPFYGMIVGVIWMIIDLWQSSKTEDDKIWWTVLGLIFAPVVVPAYWFGFGMRRKRAEPEANPDRS